MSGQTYKLRLLKSRETPEAIYVAHPRKLGRFFFLPKSRVAFKEAKEGKGWYDVTVPDWLAEEKGLL